MDLQESFDSLVKKLENKGYSADYAKGVAGKVAKEKGKMPYQQKESEDEEEMEGMDCPYAKLGRMVERALKK